mmetsp:Transcript_21754/g.50195  ORF Transcript_21754/g.50195 Transcript_21754/m.50195 type:complete len:86 (+) Transcript_21754:759-1016(+)
MMVCQRDGMKRQSIADQAVPIPHQSHKEGCDRNAFYILVYVCVMIRAKCELPKLWMKRGVVEANDHWSVIWKKFSIAVSSFDRHV